MCTRRNLSLTVALAVGAGSALAKDGLPVVDFNGSSGVGLFDSFTTDAVEGPDSLMIDTTGFGGLNVGVGPFDFNSDEMQIRIRARLLPGNEAESFAVGLVDDDGPDDAAGLGSETWEWRIPTDRLNETEFVDLVYSLGSTPLLRRQADGSVNDGDTVPNFGFEFFILQSEFNVRDRLAIEIDEIVIEPLCLTADYYVADYGGGFIGGGFGVWGDPGVLVETDNSLQIMSDDFGGGGRSFPNETAIDSERYQIRVNARLLPGNAAASFKLVLADSDGDDSGPGLGTENYEYPIPTAALVEGTYQDVFIPLTDFDFRNQNFNSTNDGDMVLNLGASEWFLQSNFGSTAALRVEVREVVIEPIQTTPGTTLEDFDLDSPAAIFVYNSFQNPGVLTAAADSIIIDTTAFGGLGVNDGQTRTFEAASTAIEITARVLAGNEANSFNIVLVDDDGDDSAPGTGNEEYQFDFSTTDFGADADGNAAADAEFVTVVQNLNNPVDRRMGFDQLFDGDMVQNYGLFQWQLASEFGGTERLHLEIDSIRLIPILPDFNADPDVNMDGDRDFFDVLDYLADPFDLTNDGVVDNDDILFYLLVFECGCPS